MILNNYNDQVKQGYREVVRSFLKAVARQGEDREHCAQVMSKKLKEKSLSDKTDITADFIRNRVHQPEKYKIAEWMAKAAYYCLLDIDEWTPDNNETWFTMIAIFVRENGGETPKFDDLKTKLPHQLDGELGFQCLKICVNNVVEIIKQKKGANV
ncbi:hypothetical protein IAH99_14200 [Vibrio cholerae]|uniref:hypothetical protein n=1 Tax=Vibrio cholerae TaxID=666 RepID=UPI001657D2FB|nr:hypothetical protein [Vibrio cholerae]MBC9069498.1 hypothetical protein [Vibrio cholerae]